MLQQVEERILALLEPVGIAGTGVLVVVFPVDRLVAGAGVSLRQQAFQRLLGRVVGIAVVEVAVGEGEVHRLVEGVDVPGRVVAHSPQIGVLQDVQCLEHDGSLHPGRQLVDVDAAVVRAHRFLDVDLPAVEVGHRHEPAQFLRPTDELFGDVAAVEAVVGGGQGLLARLALLEGGGFRVDELAQGVEKVRLAEDLAGARGGASVAFFRRRQVGQEDPRRIRPLLEHLLASLHVVGLRSLDRVAVRHLDRGFEHLGEAHRSVVGEHHDQAARGARRHRRERTVLRGIDEAPLAVEVDRGAGRGHPECVDSDHFPRVRVEDQGLRLAAPAQGVPHRRGRGEHGAGRVDGVAAAAEDQGAGRGGERFACHRHPMAAVQDRFDRALRFRSRHGEGKGQGADDQNRPSHCRGSISLARGAPAFAEAARTAGGPLIACRSLPGRRLRAGPHRIQEGFQT